MSLKRKSPSSWSFTGDEHTTRYDHGWSIANFDRQMAIKPGQMLKSGTFSIIYKGESTEWNLEMYPNGDCDGDRGYMSLYLVMANDVISEPVEVEAFFYVINQQGIKKNEYYFKRMYVRKGDGIGATRYINHTEVNLPSNKTFTVLCDMSVNRNIVVRSGSNKFKTRLLNNEPIKTNLSPLDMSSFIESGEFSDCVVTCGSKEYKCHRVILAGRSSVFKAMFSYDLKENRSSEVVIEDLGENTVNEMINYMYSGNLEMNLNDQAIDLLTAADKYDLKELKERCESHLCQVIDIANVCDILIVAYLHNSKSLLDVAFQFVYDNGDDVLKKTGFKEKLKLYPDILMKIIEGCIKNQS